MLPIESNRRNTEASRLHTASIKHGSGYTEWTCGVEARILVDPVLWVTLGHLGDLKRDQLPNIDLITIINISTIETNQVRASVD